MGPHELFDILYPHGLDLLFCVFVDEIYFMFFVPSRPAIVVAILIQWAGYIVYFCAPWASSINYVFSLRFYTRIYPGPGVHLDCLIAQS